MLPTRLIIENFGIHRFSDLDFTKFNSALIIGKSKSNLEESNATGKSTIFRAIRFVLFGEYDVDKVEKIIFKNAKKAVVTFEFILNNVEYKIRRTRTKTSQTLEFWEKINNEWVSKSATRTGDLEADIYELIKINDITFQNSAMFSQKDLAGLISAKSAKDRMEMFKNILSLNIYSILSKYTKEEKLKELNKLIYAQKTLIASVGDPQASIKENEEKLNITKNILNEKNSKRTELLQSLHTKEKQLLLIESSVDDQTKSLLKEAKDIENKINLEKNQLSYLNKKKEEIEGYLKNTNSTILSLNKEIEKIQESYNNLRIIEVGDKVALTEDYHKTQEDLLSINTEIGVLKNDLIHLNHKLPQDPICPECLQQVDLEYRSKYLEQNTIKINEINNKINDLKIKSDKLNSKKNKISQDLINFDNHTKQLVSLTNKLTELKQKFQQQNELLELREKDKNSLIDQINSLSSRINELENHKKELDQLPNNSEEIINLNKIIKELKNEILLLEQSIQQGTSNILVLEERISNKQEDVKKLIEYNKELDRLNYECNLFNLVSKAFTEIPGMIILNILDDLQFETNQWLSKIRPNLEIVFSVDSFECSFKKEGVEFDLNELSGGQETMVRLALKLGLIETLKKKLNIQLNMLFLDEVDERMDMAASKAFLDIIKSLEKDYKIFVITHRDSLKSKFLYAILVEYENMEKGTTATVVNSW